MPNSIDFNSRRQDLLKVQLLSGDTIMFTKDEATTIIKGYIADELELFAENLTKERRKELEDRIKFKLNQVEANLIRHVDEKIAKITERVVEFTINRKIEEEVNKRVEDKLKKIRGLL